MERDWIYDMETFPNICTLAIVRASDRTKRKVFEISTRKNDIESLLDCLRWIRKKNHRMVGFNNIGFDYPVLHKIMQRAIEAKANNRPIKISAKWIYDVAMEQIESGKMGFPKVVKPVDELIRQIDLYRIWHFDNKAKATSLKMLEFNMRSDNIQDLPFPVGTVLSEEQMDELVSYNFNDIDETLNFYIHTLPAIKMREELTEEFGFDCLNYNDTKIGKELFINTLEKEKPGSCYTPKPHGGRSLNQTKRKQIHLKECIFPYIKFSRPEFQAVLKWFQNKTITETKGSLTDILEHELGDVAKYAEMLTKRKKINDPADTKTSKNKRYVPTEEHLAELRKEHPMGWVEEKELKSPKGAKSYYWCYNIATNLNVVIDGFRWDFGTGGIHGATNGIHKSGNGKIILTYDVASYYPNMAISNNVYPKHLGLTFCTTYKYLYDKRKATPKALPANGALKLALNGTYGDSNNEYSPLYDPQYTMTITIGGQLSLCMLAERLIDECQAQVIMANTDGLEFIVDESKKKQAEDIVKWWEITTKLEMEGDIYDTMYIRDVNNYISVTKSGKVKTKGAYEIPEYKTEGYDSIQYEKLGWHKNHSALIIPFAVAEYFLKGIPIEETIRGHKNAFDFMLRTKVPRSSRLVLVVGDFIEEEQQNICRYYPSTNGGKLVKIMPPLPKDPEKERRLGIDTDWNVRTCNRMSEFQWDINYDYYIDRANKLIQGIMTGESFDDNEDEDEG